ncbi:MAG: helix-turn-helix transcriptional regulator [Acutalibacteraceae bacterium]|nr:helix-turn-helix transcriptional regulator [Acutalibacteraceae bacterium]
MEKEKVIAKAVVQGGEVLKEYRESKGIKAAEVARAMGLTQQHVYYYERSKALCSRLIKAYMNAIEKIENQ